MNDQLKLTIELFEVHTRVFSNAIDGLEAYSRKRPNEFTNHVAWLAGHLTSTRYMLATVIGQDVQEPHPDFFAQGKGIDTALNYPSLEETAGYWNEISPKLIGALKELPDVVLSADAPFPVPLGNKMDVFIGFFVHHEAYHIGQLGLLRKFFGEQALTYK